MDEPVLRGYRGEVRDVPALVRAVQAAPARIQLLRADRVHGTDHLRLAATLAARALTDGRSRSPELPTETLLYAAGERQIGKALTFIGLHEGATEIAAIAWDDDGALDALAREHDWTRDDSVLDGDARALDAFGITDGERAMLPREKWGDLVLERVALVDVLKA